MFGKKNTNKKVAVIGLGGFGGNLVRYLSSMKDVEILAIDINPVNVAEIKDLAAKALTTNAAIRENLESIGIADVEYAVVSSGPGLETSIMTVHVLKELGVPHIIAKALNADHEKILHLVGATEVVFPERDSAEKVANRIQTPNLIDYIPLQSGFVIQEIKIPGDFSGKTLGEIELRKKFKVTVLAIKPVSQNENIINPSANARLKENDILVLFGESKDIAYLDEAMNHS
jgi:trk system potassium uptake protein TrkA